MGKLKLITVLIVCALALSDISYAQAQSAAKSSPPELSLDTGKQIFEAACIGCHGPGGKGQPQSTLGFEPPSTFPDFSDCNGSTREKIYDWRATIHQGGRGRGFSEIMPSFAEALTLGQINLVVQYLRTLCDDRSWPLGELNLPRAIMTEKAYPEDEVVLTGATTVRGESNVSGELIYEKRFGTNNQLEFAVPLSFLKKDTGTWIGGIGDLVLGYKRVLAHSARFGSILSFQGEFAAPTGNQSRGFGSGVPIFETFLAYGQVLPKLSFVQIQAGAELPTNEEKAARVTFGRMALGKTLTRGFGRSWTPIMELVAEHEHESGAKTNLDVVPQMQVTLNRRQHVRVSVGYQKPVNYVAGRPKQVVFYLLWDWFDGGFREGW